MLEQRIENGVEGLPVLIRLAIRQYDRHDRDAMVG
jgi:hypothetical protein